MAVSIIPSVSDYVVEQGTTAIWTYRKWASGKFEAYNNGGYLNLGTGTAWCGGYHHKANEFDIPSFAVTAQVVAMTNNTASLCWCVDAHVENRKVVSYWMDGSSSTGRVSDSRTVLVGTWR